MTINREELYKLYMQWVDEVTEQCDWVTHFGPTEIIGALVNILEDNPHLINFDNYSPYQKEVLGIK